MPKAVMPLRVGAAALALASPLAAAASDLSGGANRLSNSGIRQYSSSHASLTTINQFSDLQPTDWAYQAISSLIEHGGCLAGTPSGGFSGSRAISRFEAAALLNACLDRIHESTDALKRLQTEFAAELALLQGRTDGLEARVGVLAATQFSTTTKLSGLATFVVGGVRYMGSNSGAANADTPFTTANNQANLGGTVFNYDLRLTLDTSFTGKDLLRTVLRAANAQGSNGSAFGTGLTTMEAFFEQPAGDNELGVFQLFYNLPLGDQLTASAGPLVRGDDPGMLGLWPSVYPAETILDYFTHAGSPNAYTMANVGGGAGFVYSPHWAKGLTLSQNYIAGIGSSFGGSVGLASSGNPSLGGVMTNGSGSGAISQIGYTGERAPLIGGSYGIALAYSYTQNLALDSGTPLALFYSDYNNSNGGYTSANNVGLSGYWKPERPGLIPSISWGLGGGSYSISNNGTYGTAVQGITTASWYTGLQWDDAFRRGNVLGMAVGQAPFVTNAGSAAANTPRFFTTEEGYANGAFDSNMLWEWWYRIQLTDSIAVTPALFFISAVDGQYGRLNTSNGQQNASNNALGGLLKTTFKF